MDSFLQIHAWLLTMIIHSIDFLDILCSSLVSSSFMSFKPKSNFLFMRMRKAISAAEKFSCVLRNLGSLSEKFGNNTVFPSKSSKSCVASKYIVLMTASKRMKGDAEIMIYRPNYAKSIKISKHKTSRYIWKLIFLHVMTLPT